METKAVDDRCCHGRRGSRRPRCPVHDRRLVGHGIDADEAGGADPVFHQRARESSQRAPQHSHRRGLVGPGRAGRFDVCHSVHDRWATRGCFRVSPSCVSSTLGRRPDVHLQRRRGRQLHGQLGGCSRLHHAARRHGLRFRTPARVHRARSRRRRCPGARRQRGLSASGRRPGHHHPQQRGRLLGTRDHSTSIRSTAGRTTSTNGLGPMARYRCNEFGHLCLDPSGDPQKWIPPPDTAPPDAQGTPSAPTLSLTDCESLDEDGLLTPVSTLVSGIKALKADPDIRSSSAPSSRRRRPTRWTGSLRWAVRTCAQGELWPQIEPSCGSSDGSSGEPAVRITQLVKDSATNGFSTSICDSSLRLRQPAQRTRQQDRRSPPKRGRRSQHLRRGRLGGGRLEAPAVASRPTPVRPHGRRRLPADRAPVFWRHGQKVQWTDERRVRCRFLRYRDAQPAGGRAAAVRARRRRASAKRSRSRFM